MLCLFVVCLRAAKGTGVVFIFWMVNPGEAGVVVGSAANGRQKSGSAGLRELLYVTERTCTLNTPDPSLTLCSHA